MKSPGDVTLTQSPINQNIDLQLKEEQKRGMQTTEDFVMKAHISDQIIDTETINEALKRMPTDEHLVPDIKIDLKQLNGPL